MWPHGRAQTDIQNPDPFAVCDRCGCLFNHSVLSWQYEWRGNQLQNLYLLVCPECLDVPQQQFRPVIIPPDPVPIQNPRPPFWAQQEAQAGVPPQIINPVQADDEPTP